MPPTRIGNRPCKRRITIELSEAADATLLAAQEAIGGIVYNHARIFPQEPTVNVIIEGTSADEVRRHYVDSIKREMEGQGQSGPPVPAVEADNPC